MNECLRCGWRWDSRIESRPKNCPGCKSAAWDRPKVDNKVAAKANNAVAAAVKKGELIKIPCEVCGEIKSEAHHEDYEKPLEVRWLCRKHHRQRHSEIGGPLMGGGLNLRGLNLRGVPDELARELKSEAYLLGMKYHEYCVEILASRKKIAEDTPRGGSPESGDDTSLSRGGKAQDADMRPRTITGKWPLWSEAHFRKIAEEEPGGLMACSPEILGDMLEAAKSDPATAATLHLAGVKLDKEILERWGLVGEVVAKIPTLELREIAAGNIPVPSKISGGQDTSKEGADICGYKEFNPTDGEDYMCGKEKHGPKVKHGEWVKI